MGITIACSMFLVGGGQLYNGQTEKGVGLVLGSIALLLLGFVGYVLIWIIATVDAILIGQRLIRGESVTPTQWF
jgi:hypothetical protein